MEKIKQLYHHFERSSGISTDTRTLSKGQIYFALKGPYFDGNQYASMALEEGASFAVVDDPKVKFQLGAKAFLVDDVLKGLQQLANFHRKQFDIPIIGLTGSNGKTTTKELMAAVLEKKYKVHFTKGNLNNHIGVPLTLLEMPQDTEIAVIEMGANHVGEIAELSHIIEPTHGLITNIGKAHIEGFGGQDGVLRGKTELFDFLNESRGKILMNREDRLLRSISGKYPEYLSFGLETIDYFVNDVGLLNLRIDGVEIKTQLYGIYNVFNIAAAHFVGCLFDVEEYNIWDAVLSYNPDNNRSQIVDKKGIQFILDAYNANPSSMQLSINSFVSIDAQSKGLILGGMKELGEYEQDEHQQIIDLLVQYNFTKVILVGKEFESVQRPLSFELYDNVEQLIEKTPKLIFDKGSTVLIKGSRSNYLERFFDQY